MVEIICNNYLLYTLMVVFVLGVLSRMVLVLIYSGLRSGTGSQGVPSNKYLKQMKTKYENYDRVNIKVPDINAFVVRSMYEYRFCGMSLRFLEKVLGQAIFWCVVIGGIAVWYGYFMNLGMEIIALYSGTSLLFGVILFNISKITDAEYLRESTEACVVDYLESQIRERDRKEQLKEQVKEELRQKERPKKEVKEAYIKPEEVSSGLFENPEAAEDRENRIIEEVLNEIFC